MDNEVPMPGASPAVFGGVGKDAAQVIAGAMDRLTAVLREALTKNRRIEFEGFRGSFEDGKFAVDGVVYIGPVEGDRG